VIYLARRRLALADGTQSALPGSGVFGRDHRLLRLTDPRSPVPIRWRLPAWMHPGEGRAAMTYHRDQARWSRSAGITRLRSTARGQEFVFSQREYRQALDWLQALMRRLETS